MTATAPQARVPVLGASEAVAIAAELSGAFAEGAADRDAHRVLPSAEAKSIRASF